MAWEHSYTAQAYEDARAVLETWSRGDMALALADTAFENGKISDKDIDKEQERLSDLPHDILVQACMDAILETYTCDNGGWAMWIDPDGCHRVELPR